MAARNHHRFIAAETLKHLDARGVTLEDFAVWNWILSGATAHNAALRLELTRLPLCEATADLGPLPPFIIQRLLLRNDINAQALSILIRQIWRRFIPDDQQSRHDHHTELHRKTSEPVELDTLAIMIVRLLRQTRIVWPSAITNIAELWVTLARNNGTNQSRLSFYYNRLLQLIALPSNELPYQSLHHRQRAFFVLYHRMIDPKSRLTVSREGYRAFIQIQLAHRKTASEREWALLKGPGWPPWKADRTGMDADIGPESGVSRAATGIRHAAASGYRSGVRERAARILAGTDDDNSPTIQTRSVMMPISVSSRPRGSKSRPSAPPVQAYGSNLVCKTSEPDAPVIWIARVKATRTLHEAWECFLACRDQGTPMVPQLYETMIEKVLYDDKRREDCQNQADSVQHDGSPPKQHAVPGDGREVAEASTSYNQAVSTREPLPTVSSLLQQMMGHGFPIRGRLLALLLTHARSYEEGIEALRMSRMDESVRMILLHWGEQPGYKASPAEVQASLKTLPDWLLAAYIEFLCRFAETATNPDSGRISIAMRLRYMKQAFRLVKAGLPMYRPCWNHLLHLLSRNGSVVLMRWKRHLEPVFKFERACQLLASMDSLQLDLDFSGFSEFCAIANNAHAKADAQGRVEAVKTRFARLVQPSNHTHRGLYSLYDYCHSVGHGVGADKGDKNGPGPLPRLFRTPHPAHLHVYIRCLGQHDDYDGLVELMHWLAAFADEVIDEAKESANGRTMFRRCLTALRFFAGEERSQEWASGLDNLRIVLHDREDSWSEWPSDEDVERYFSSQDHQSL
ncbi:MAG: hypothetical protein Q9168_006794 [Polycauliona sp. 1 TL-2023]